MYHGPVVILKPPNTSFPTPPESPSASGTHNLEEERHCYISQATPPSVCAQAVPVIRDRAFQWPSTSPTPFQNFVDLPPEPPSCTAVLPSPTPRPLQKPNARFASLLQGNSCMTYASHCAQTHKHQYHLGSSSLGEREVPAMQ